MASGAPRVDSSGARVSGGGGAGLAGRCVLLPVLLLLLLLLLLLPVMGALRLQGSLGWAAW